MPDWIQSILKAVLSEAGIVAVVLLAVMGLQFKVIMVLWNRIKDMDVEKGSLVDRLMTIAELSNDKEKSFIKILEELKQSMALMNERLRK